MGIESPATYGEYYWRTQVDAARFFDEGLEDLYSPYFRGLLNTIPEISKLPRGIEDFVRALAEPHSAGMGGFAIGVGVESIDEILHSALQPMMSMLSREVNRRAREKWLTSQQANILYQRKKIPSDFWSLVLASEGYEDVLHDFAIKAEMPYPSIPDLVLYSRYHGDPSNVWSTLQDFYNIDPADFRLWDWLGLQRLTAGDAHTLLRRGLMSEGEYHTELSQIGWSRDSLSLVKELGWTVPNAMLVVQGDLMQQVSTEKILADISFADIHPRFAQNYFDAILTKPASTDIIAYELRRDPNLSSLDQRLRQIGIHPDYFSLYKELAYPIPPVADIITMAVREAFTPAIAARFGQYEDLPPEYVTNVQKKGLSKEWAERYWASHWALPSAMQGVEMLHRGVINEDELNLLLRALDVMPFWRDRLTKIAYRQITRVDIRRMYQTGVMNEKDVLEAYTKLGYSDKDAGRMTEFTIKQSLATQAKFTSTDVVAAYSKSMITRSEARTLLENIGVRSENIDFILTAAEYKRAWQLTDDRIAAIKNLYHKAVYDDNDARSELLKLDLPADQVNVLMEQWYIDEKDKPARLWTTAQTLSFIKDGRISAARGRQELVNIGYDDEHIKVYMESVV